MILNVPFVSELTFESPDYEVTNCQTSKFSNLMRSGNVPAKRYISDN